MSKILKNALVAMVAVLFLQMPCYASTATLAEDEATSQDIIYVENQVLTMEKGKEYILSYPVSSDEWKISEIKLQIKNNEWVTIKEGIENERFKVKIYQNEQGRIFIKITCKTEDITAIKVVFQNDKDNKALEHTTKITFKKQEENNNQWWIIIPSQPGGENDKNDGKEELIVIDTSGWVFQGVKKVYDGKEYVALVTGLPDYVTPVYQDNIKTNAGEYKAYVTFEVPEGYAVPKGMETQIVIDKATIEEIELDRMWMLTDLEKGTIEIKMPVGVVPDGVVNCQYKVNGTDVGSSYKITDTGIYSVSANFSLTDEMKDNYILKTDTANTIYQVNPEGLGEDKPSCNIIMNELAGDNDGQKKVCIWIEYPEGTSPNVNNVQWKLRYDPDVLEIESTSKEESSLASQKEYDGSDSSGIGYGMAASMYYRDGAGIETITFNVKDSEATDIVVNITEVEAGDYMNIGPKENINGYGIVLNQESNIISVTLPNKAPTTKNNDEPNQAMQLPSDETEVSNEEHIQKQEEQVAQTIPEVLNDEGMQPSEEAN